MVVEFPEETDENGILNMCIVPSNWVLCDENSDDKKCLWPNYLKGGGITKAIMAMQPVDASKCTTVAIHIKYKTSKYIIKTKMV